jgi:hypothetical protein
VNEHEDCGHSEVHHVIMKLAEEVAFAVFKSCRDMVRTGEMTPGEAGLATARMIFAAGIETGVRSCLMDSIGSQMLLAHLDENTTLDNAALDAANDVITADARLLMEAMARVASS